MKWTKTLFSLLFFILLFSNVYAINYPVTGRVSKIYKNSLYHFYEGFEKGEGSHSGGKTILAFNMPLKYAEGETFILDESKAIRIPNGYYLHPRLGSKYLNGDPGTWQYPDLGISVVQKPYLMNFEYYYKPHDYNITYDLAGGVQNSANPSTYNVLYGAEFKAPTKAGYDFVGWEDVTGNIITSINFGLNNKFINGDDMYNKLQSRRTGDIRLKARWTKNSVKNEVFHYAGGFLKGEGNRPGTPSNFVLSDKTYFANETGKNYNFTDQYHVRIPNGYYIYKNFASNSLPPNDGKWHTYPLGTSYTQNSKTMYFQYTYEPYTYKINYNLNGGQNSPENYFSYNILYGVKMHPASKTGYTFTGWYDKNNNKVTGVNEGKNANFASAQELYDELDRRQTGDVFVEARWTPNKYSVEYYDNFPGGGSKAESVTYDQSWNVSGFSKNSRPGYQLVSWNTSPDGTGTEYKLNSQQGSWKTLGNIKLYAQWKASTNTPYKINHYQQNLTDDGYTLLESENLTGLTNTQINVSATKKTYTGFDYVNTKVDNNIVTNTVIKPDGSLVINHYYNRQLFMLDVDSIVDGVHNNQGNNIWTFSVKINGIVVDERIGDYCREHRYGSTYEIFNINHIPEYSYKVSDRNPLKGTITKRTDVDVIFTRSYYDIEYQGGTGSIGSMPVSHRKTNIDEPLDKNLFTKKGFVFGGWKLKEIK